MFVRSRPHSRPHNPLPLMDFRALRQINALAKGPAEAQERLRLRKINFFDRFFQNFPNASECIRTHPGASERIRTHPNRSTQVPASPKTSNLRSHEPGEAHENERWFCIQMCYQFISPHLSSSLLISPLLSSSVRLSPLLVTPCPSCFNLDSPRLSSSLLLSPHPPLSSSSSLLVLLAAPRLS